MDQYYETIRNTYNREIKFTPQQYKKINSIVEAYKNGNNKASEELLKEFAPFLLRFAVLLSTGEVIRIIYTNKGGYKSYKTPRSISQFLQFYSDEPISKNKKAFKQACEKIKALYSKYEFGDMFHEAFVALMDLVNNFESGSFVKYLNAQYHFYLSNRLRKLNDKAFNKAEYIDPPEKPYSIVYKQKEYNDSILESNNKELDWLLGRSCSNVFKNLTFTERRIILESFWYNKTVNEISKNNLMTDKQVRIILSNSINKLRAALKQNKLLKED